MSKLLVYLTALFFLLYGAIFAVFPVEMANLITGSSPNSTSATIDFRATYGGAQFAVGLALILVLKIKQDVTLALVIVAITLLSMAFGRLIGILLDGQPNTLMYVYLVAELLFGSLALYLRKSEAPEANA
ncbi:DUF4345 domain-containing protein [Vibrio harveyi]|uniref:DUF4345 domain-containing protein n=1 Tax=Vibrio TaxID=662 RepID=UPI0009384CB8|nr:MULTISPECIES: DUF4345 domain-containing protein [Vibrio]GMQ46736.1 hypothetical protein VB10N_17350 [Vibrio sp. 10N]APP04878.1 hypothetical protein BG259_05755 [Vibrio harveyi]EKO3782848.1 DUF4345 domain-containing protein [Vibrio harveyi]MBO0235905.1 DUF4345 domain-containing protein [Vibrio parahaemolyticus]MDG2624194.1 DUF4345 domain-containing protein [Vibrio parahaemolyticus]